MKVKIYSKSIIICLILFFGFHSPAKNQQRELTKAIVFDFGGVLANSDREEVFSFLSKSFLISQEEAQALLRRRRNLVANGGNERAFWENLAKQKKIVLPDDWFERFEKKQIESIKPIPHMKELVCSLKKRGYCIALLSNMAKDRICCVRQTRILDGFNLILFSSEIGVAKPQPQAYEILISRLDLPSSSLLFIDDRLANVMGAKQCNIDAILFENVTQLKKELFKRNIQF